VVGLALGLGALVLLLAGGEAFSRARVATIKALLAWIAALAGLSLLMLMLLSGRGASALAAVPFLAPLAISWWRERRPAGTARRGRPARAGPRMSRAEALEVLGLREGATEAEIRAAWLRLMQGAHPDRGGSDWLAAKLNQARDVLLGR
jgi:DnaJ-domain-containing protein 1